MDLLSVVRAPGAPFSARPVNKNGRLSRRSMAVQCAAKRKTEEEESNNIVKQIGKTCAPFAAAVFLLVIDL